VKNSYFEIGVEIEKKAHQKFLFGSSYLLQKFERILTFNLRGDRFSDEKNPKTGVFDRFFAYSKKYIALINKNALQKFQILIIQVMLKFRFISK
jgi:hypothetical protein